MIQLRDRIKPDTKELKSDNIDYTINNLLSIIIDSSKKFVVKYDSDLEQYLKILDVVIYIMNESNGTCCLVVPTIEEELTLRNSYLNSLAKYCVVNEYDFHQDYQNYYKHIIFLNTEINKLNQINNKPDIGFTIIHDRRD